MTDAGPNAQQAEYWNAPESHHWVDKQERYDRMLAPFAAALLDAARIEADDRVLDVGCGTGGTTCEAARVAKHGDATGFDISHSMIDAARERARALDVTNVAFEVADVQVGTFDPRFDVAISRFGVMFFDDPVAAFANVRTALSRDAGRLVFACWQPVFANEWMLVPMSALAQHIPLPEPPAPGMPGPFSLGEPDRLDALLGDAGFRDVEIEPVTPALLLAGGGTVDDAVAFLRSTGMARLMLADAPDDTVARALDAVREALRPYLSDEGVRLASAAWVVTAKA